MDLRPIQVARVVDGDTVVDTDGQHYRLYGIDAPEKRQEYGPQASAALVYMLHQHHNVIYVQSHGRERYGRELATLYTVPRPQQDWQNLNFMLVLHGHAWVYRIRSEEAQRGQPVTPATLDMYSAAEAFARETRHGLWAADAPIRPRDFRHQKEKKARL